MNYSPNFENIFDQLFTQLENISKFSFITKIQASLVQEIDSRQSDFCSQVADFIVHMCQCSRSFVNSRNDNNGVRNYKPGKTKIEIRFL